MKKNFKVLGIMLSITMILSLFAGCGGSATEEVEEVNKVTVLSGFNITWMGDVDTYSTDSNMTINEFGQIATVAKTYGDVSCTYEADGALARVDFTNSDKVGFETWTRVDGMLSENEYAPNDGFRSHRATTYDVTTDESGHVVVLAENNTFTDAEDGSVSKGVTKYEFEYGDDGVLNSVKYYNDEGKLDHTTNLQYDEAGNLITYANVGAESNNVYLSVSFIYSEVDEGTVTPIQLDGYTNFMNFTGILEHVL